MSSSNRAGRVCPLCGKRYTAPPALSRRDNATNICPECGTMEALAAMEERWCACSGHRSKDFSKLTDYYCRHFIPDGWQLQYSTLTGPEPERLLYLIGKCDQCGGFMRSGVSIACNWTGERLLLDICRTMLQHRPYDGRDKTGIYRGGCARRSEWYWKQDQLPRAERIEQFVSLFRESDQSSARLWAEKHMPAPPVRRETAAEFFNAVVELVQSNGFWPEQSAFITCEPARPDAALCHPMFDFRPVLTAEHGGGLRIDCYLNGIFDHAGNSKRLAGTIQTACSDRDTCVLMGSLTGALLHYGGVHREENLDRYVPLHNRDMKKEI